MLESRVGDHVFLSVSPMNRMMRFEKRGKIIPKYIRQFKMLQNVGDVAYELD